MVEGPQGPTIDHGRSAWATVADEITSAPCAPNDAKEAR